MAEKSFEELYKEFHEKFPIEKLQEMKLETYTNTADRNGFTWWMLKYFGDLGSFYKSTKVNFGIYKYEQEPTFGNLKEENQGSDNTYAWKKEFGETAEKAFNTIKDRIIKIANIAKKLPVDSYESTKHILKEIEKIHFPRSLKWKIAFLYSSNTLIDWYSLDWLKKFIAQLAPAYNLRNNSTAEMQLKLMEIRAKNYKNDEKFYRDLCKIFNGESILEQHPPKTVDKLVKLLKNTHNLILHGAPGTGKTYLAKQIAQKMIFGEVKQKLTKEEEKIFNEQVGFVQFHPSYDYTDFVEGLRPVKNDEENQIGFERKNGQFKEFCKQALKTTIKDSADNFELKWKELIETLNNQDFIDIPLSKGNRTMKIELNEYGTGLANRTYENDEYKKGDWIRGQSKFFNKDQLYNVYKGLPGVPSGGHDNYRQAIINYMKNNMNLLEYKQGTSNPEKAKPFIFIIDEINRGELSKIFGELFFAIDPGYRGESGKIKTQYQNLVESGDAFADGFFVPENVYIIGTMNDIDRSVESMDLAMRRRFTFKEITAEDSQKAILTASNEKLKDLLTETVEELKNRMNELNNAIWSKDENNGGNSRIEGLSSDYHIGAAYFLKFADYYNPHEENTDEAFKNLWAYNLEPLLREYLRGMDDESGKLQTLREAYNESRDKIDDTAENSNK